MEWLKVVGFDPSLSNWGMCKFWIQKDSIEVAEIGIVETKPSKQLGQRKNSLDLERGKDLYDGVTAFLEDVDLVCVEIPVGSQSANGMKSYGMCIGILASIDIPMIQVTPKQVKSITGKPSATKKEMIQWAKTKHPEASWFNQNKDEHVADAMAAVYAGMQTDMFKLLRK